MAGVGGLGSESRAVGDASLRLWRFTICKAG